MNRLGRIAVTVVSALACLLAGHPRPAPAAGPDAGYVVTVTATIRSVDAGRGVIAVERAGGAPLELGMDGADTLIFRGIRTLTPDELAGGMRVEIDYRPTAGDAMPRAVWIEVLDPDATRRPAAGGSGDRAGGDTAAGGARG